MKSTNNLLGKILYAILFLAIIPGLLWGWVQFTGHLTFFPVIGTPFWGMIFSALGGILMIWGMISLMVYGGGLPMNAFPPKKFVTKGPYQFINHPIYWGFGILLAGISIWAKSTEGLWLVTPITILGMIALVMGFENIDLKKRFPAERSTMFLDIPANEITSPKTRDLLSASFWGIAMFLFVNFIVCTLFSSSEPLFGRTWNIHPLFNSTPLYLFSILFFISVPMALKQKKQIREWIISCLIGLALAIYIALLWPEVGAQYFPSELQFEGIYSAPAIYLMGVPLFLILISLRSYISVFKKQAGIFLVLALVLGFYQLINSQSSTLHLITSVLIFSVAVNYLKIWIYLKRMAEKIANSWQEWVFGPVRIINHGFYVGFAAFIGILISGGLAGNSYAWAILVFSVIVIVFSAVWAQLIEGSEKLKRPYGYYGALVGIIFASLAVWAMGMNVWVIIGVISVVMPWLQGIGRIRCLINGCCHGSQVENEHVGIRYFHPRSRVCGISGLKGELLHPTPLYAMIWLFLMGFVLLAFWLNHMPYPFIFGMYLILTGMGRFVEEAYRGEVQTPIISGLRLYQWTALFSVIVGVFISIIPVSFLPVLHDLGWETWVAAIIGGLFTFFAMGVDFPKSNARFSRLV